MFTYKLPHAMINLAQVVEIYDPEINPETGGVKVSIRFKAAGCLDHYLLAVPVSHPPSLTETVTIKAAYDALVKAWEEALQRKYLPPFSLR
jgi:hypothetical protein